MGNHSVALRNSLLSKCCKSERMRGLSVVDVEDRFGGAAGRLPVSHKQRRPIGGGEGFRRGHGGAQSSPRGRSEATRHGKNSSAGAKIKNTQKEGRLTLQEETKCRFADSQV
mmetsp:Transcript_7721/g.16910  ORF Transcript_7721/g.16910 Transcript_7721/m.16910 type:complete len:112 (-) Transcript_7721:17-352(-)